MVAAGTIKQIVAAALVSMGGWLVEAAALVGGSLMVAAGTVR